MNREFTLLFILNMFETEIFPAKYTQQPVQHVKTALPASLLIAPEQDVVLNQKRDVTCEARLPLFSLSRGKVAMKIHAMFHLLMQFHLPEVTAHLDRVLPTWWYPYSYPIEKQEDFITVGLLAGIDR